MPVVGHLTAVPAQGSAARGVSPHSVKQNLSLRGEGGSLLPEETQPPLREPGSSACPCRVLVRLVPHQSRGSLQRGW